MGGRWGVTYDPVLEVLLQHQRAPPLRHVEQVGPGGGASGPHHPQAGRMQFATNKWWKRCTGDMEGQLGGRSTQLHARRTRRVDRGSGGLVGCRSEEDEVTSSRSGWQLEGQEESGASVILMSIHL